MRIGVDARILGRRGIGRYVKNLLAAMGRLPQAHEFVLFLGPKSDPDALPQGPAFSTLRLEPGHPAWQEQARIPALARKMGVDLLHFPDNTGPVFSGFPFVLTLHDSMWRRPLSETVARPDLGMVLQDFYRKQVCPRAARRARLVLTISQSSRRDLCANLGLPESKVRVAPLALDPLFGEKPGGQEAGQRLRALGVRAPYILCSGAVDKRKNVEGLMRAFALARPASPLLAEACLVVSSMKPEDLAATRYEDEARRLGLEKEVVFLPYVSDADLKALYSQALVFAFPSTWEGFGLPLLEAFAMGCPVVASNTTSLPEIAGQAALLVDPTDPKALSQALIQASDPATAETYKQRGRARLKDFAWETTAKLTLEAYEEAI